MNICNIKCVNLLIVQCLCKFLTVLKLKINCDKAVEKDSKMLKFVPDYFKPQEMCEKAVKNCCFLLKIHVPDEHKNQQMCGKIVSENPGILQFILNC